MSTPIKFGFKNTREQNVHALERAKWQSPEEKSDISFMERKFGIDLKKVDGDTKEFPVLEGSFNWKKCRETILRESDQSTAFLQVLRAGVQTIVNSMYQSVPTTFEDWAQVVPSKLDTELYAPIQGIGFPQEVAQSEQYGEVGAAGLDLKLQNRKYGTLWPVSKELVDDDQTGQFSKQASLLGVYAKQVLEVLAYGKLASASGMKYGNMTVPQCETQPSAESTYPYNTAFAQGAGANRPSSYGALTQANIQNGMIALMNQLNILGLKMNVEGRRLLISPKYRFDAGVLLNSAWYPSGAASAGSVGGAFANNMLKGLLDLTVSRFMFDQNGSVSANSARWIIVDDSQPFFVVQVKEAAAIEQEAPMSGASFEKDVYRFKVRTRGNADFIDPRFAWQGSDGSA